MVKGKTTNININANECGHKCKHKSCGGCGYFLGFVGATIYYISNSNSFWEGVVGILKAAVWPLFLVWELLRFIGA